MSRRLLLLLAGVLLVLGFTSCQLQDMTADASQGLEFSKIDADRGTLTELAHGGVVDLWAGAGNPDAAVKVGSVTIDKDKDGDNYFAEYRAFFPWTFSEVHFAIEESMEAIPQTKKGNPISGHFEYSYSFDQNKTYYRIDLGPLASGTEYSIAAHAAVVGYGGLEAFTYPPEYLVHMTVDYPVPGGPSYFTIHLSDAGPNLNGTYEGWCVDTDHYIYQNTVYNVHLYSSYANLVGVVEHPENFDLVNYIVNNFQVGMTIPGGVAPLNYSDIQRAIWELIEDAQSTNGLEPIWHEENVAAILDDAYALGEGFVPGCGDSIALVCVPDGGSVQVIVAQVTIAMLPVPCGETQEETAWGDGKDGKSFPGANWATYFTFKP
jgi:hypothetical protein